jgi:hypothetical protein
MLRLFASPRGRGLIPWAIILALGSMSASFGEAQSSRPPSFEQTGVFASARLLESSGVAVSRAHPGILWTHNDSGDDPIVYATDMSGTDLGAFRLLGASAVDWEDVAIADCPSIVGMGDCLFIADTGDNDERRESAAIYIVREPSPERVLPGETESVEVAHVVTIRYLDGPRDVEALGVAPDGRLLLITKGRNRNANIYWVQASSVTDGTAVLTVADSLQIEQERRLDRMVTAAAISPDGSRLVVRTYTELFFLEIGDRDNGRLLLRDPPCWIGAQQIQGEAVDFLDGEWVVLTSEAVFGRLGSIAKARCDGAENLQGEPVLPLALAETGLRR